MNINRIEKWADERYLYETPHNENAFLRMVLEEIGEYLDAETNNYDKEGMVDALGDITVFAVGELPRLGTKADNVFLTYGRDIKEFKKQFTTSTINELTTAENLTKILCDFIGATKDRKIDVIKQLSLVCWNKIEDLGYCPDCVMDEILKEIESRTGEFSEEHGKWMKYKTPEAIAKWYKADFSDCKKD